MAKRKLVKGQDGIIYKIVAWESCTSNYRQAYVIGWQNVMDDADWHPAYDDLTREMQQAYEYGRLDAMNVKATGIPVPFWGTISKTPQAVSAANNEAYWYWYKKDVEQTARPKRTIVNKYGDVIGME